MLIFRTYGPDLVEELDISEDEEIVITISDGDIQEQLEIQQQIPLPQSSTSKKRRKQEKANDIKCRNKFFKNLSFEDVPIIRKEQILDLSLNFGRISSPAFKLDQINKHWQYWPDEKSHVLIPEKQLPDEIQDIQLFIPKITGVNDQLVTNTLFLNRMNEKKLIGVLGQHEFPKIQPIHTHSRKDYIQSLKDLQREQIGQRKTK